MSLRNPFSYSRLVKTHFYPNEKISLLMLLLSFGIAPFCLFATSHLAEVREETLSSEVISYSGPVSKEELKETQKIKRAILMSLAENPLPLSKKRNIELGKCYKPISPKFQITSAISIFDNPILEGSDQSEKVLKKILSDQDGRIQVIRAIGLISVHGCSRSF